MFEKVLFPTDFSSYANRISEYIQSMPVREVVLLHVVDTKKIAYEEETRDTASGKAEIQLQEREEFLRSKLGVKVRSEVRVGIPSHEIIKVAGEEKVSLIVMGARGKSMVEGVLMGSVTSDVLKYGNSSVLIIKHGQESWEISRHHEHIFSRVIIPVDFSKESISIISAVKMIKGLQGIELVHVVSKAETREELDLLVSEARRELNEIVKEVKKDVNVEVNIHVHVGDPVDEIDKAAEESDVSLIAMGIIGKDRERLAGHGKLRSIFEEKFLGVGTVTERVARRSKRPVLVLKNF
ncbi:MAG: universal stress protein [Archaeoglobaceae archaeon]